MSGERVVGPDGVLQTAPDPIKACPRCGAIATSVDGGVTFRCAKMHQFYGRNAEDWNP